jgi:hypothetical protein
MLFRSNEKIIFHVHIPRTGGRYVKSIFTSNSYQVDYCDFRTLIEGIELPHLHYPLYNLLKEVKETNNHFSIVRDPFERFKSVMQLVIRCRSYPNTIYELIKNKEWLFEFLEYERTINSYFCNFFRHQHEFISDKTMIYKHEDGLGDNFLEWLNDSFSINLEKNNFNYERTFHESLPIEKEIDISVKKSIEEYYEKDYNFFNYS